MWNLVLQRNLVYQLTNFVQFNKLTNLIAMTLIKVHNFPRCFDHVWMVLYLNNIMDVTWWCCQYVPLDCQNAFSNLK